MKHRFSLVIPIVMVGTLVLVLPAAAQRGSGGKPAPGGRPATHGSMGRGGGGGFRPAHPGRPMFRSRGRGYGWGRGPGWGGSGWELGYWPYWDSGDAFGYGDYEPAPPPEPAPPEPRQEATGLSHGVAPERPIQPILIERRGGQWVRVTGYAETPEAAGPAPRKAAPAAAAGAAVTGPSEAAESPRALPPAVLVFRDGHQEELNSYTIIGNTLYTKADYWISGSWTRKIEIANLNLPATLKLNQERGSEFKLPSGPNEVMIRP